MYDKIARFYDSIYSWKDYKAEVDVLVGHIRERVPRASTLLDVACGTGRHLELLKDRFDVEGLDASAQMLEVARSRQGDTSRLDDSRMVTGPPKRVVERLQEMKAEAQADELVLVTPGLDRERRAGSFTAIADAWLQAS